MSPRAYVYSVAAAVLLAAPGAASALTVTGVRFSPQNADLSVAGNSVVVISCDAVGGGMTGTPSTGKIGVSAGTIPGGVVDPVDGLLKAPITFALSGSTYTASVNWTSPTPAAVTGKCEAKATFGSITYPFSVTVSAPPVAAPAITEFSAPPSTVLVGTTNAVSVAADDAAATFAWDATGGSFTDPASASTSWVAPASQGAYTLTVTVTNAGGSVRRSAVVSTAISIYQGSLSTSLRYPRRLAAAPDGDLVVVDDVGALVLMTKRGDYRASIPDLGATAVTVGGGTAFVATRRLGIIQFDPVTGERTGTIPWNQSSTITGLAYDGARQLLWATVFESRRVVAFRLDGSVVREITTAEGRALRNPADVALDTVRDTLWVAEKDGQTGNRLHAYSAADGTWLRSMIGYGLTNGNVMEVGGVALDPAGRVFVSDVFGGTVQVMSPVGSFVGTVGTKGDVDGTLLQPRGIAFMANGDLAIANSWFNRVERFGSGASLPTCDGDADCDGMTDAFEDANFGPDAKNDPSNALADPDGDGLNYLQEFTLGTNPNAADTDGDGYADGAEVLAGYNPLDGTDHQVVVMPADLGKVPPGLVRLSAATTHTEGCAAVWSQVAGPAVTLRDAATFAPSFIARTAGEYAFEASAACPMGSAVPASVRVTVANVKPMADAGRTRTTAHGHKVAIDASFSSDANGDSLSYVWEQRLGPVTSFFASRGSLTVHPKKQGYYEFALTATDRAGAKDTRTVGLVVVDDELPTAIVASSSITAAAGASVTLDASASVPSDAKFVWTQIEPEARVVGNAATASVTLPAPGRYVFEVTATRGRVTSPPARVVVLAGEGGSLPVAVASAVETAEVRSVLSLDGGASVATSGALSYSWKQVAGPAAGLSHADSAVATAVPFQPGVHIFELTVTDGTRAVSAPALVRVDVTVGGKALPVARIAAPAWAGIDELVTLDGSTSTGANRHRWSQVSGPWVEFDGTIASPDFKPEIAGRYVFELVVDDGQVRSAPATVAVDVQ